MQWQDYRKFMGIAAYTMLVLAGFLFCKATLAANQPIRLLVPPLDSPTQAVAKRGGRSEPEELMGSRGV